MTEFAMSRQGLLRGRYELGEVVGRGGVAEVYAARDVSLERRVAIKALRADCVHDPTVRAHFRREVQSSASLNHPTVVAVYDSGEDNVGGAQVPYLVMEYVEGQSLRELLDDVSALPPTRALETVDGVLRALDYAHRMGIVHRDVKPGNVLVTTDGDIKVTDFGIASDVTDNTSTLTTQVVGTASYLSPEQARGEQVDGRGDLYSTGCVFYELLTGRPPFTGDSALGVASQHVLDVPPVPSQLNPDIPGHCDVIARKALAKDPDERYQTAGGMRADVQRTLAGLPPETADSSVVGRSRVHRRLMYALAPIAVAILAVAYVLAGHPGLFDDVAVPRFVGAPRGVALHLLQDRGLKYRVTKSYSKDYAAGLVAAQRPDPGARVERGSVITVTVSRGKARVQVPNLLGTKHKEATRLLRDFDLRLGDVDHRASARPAGRVVDIAPSGGTRVRRDARVDLVVSTGKVNVPDVVGEQRSDAEAVLDARGFDADVNYTDPGSGPTGVVIDQDPPSSGAALPGTVVTIDIPLAPPEPSQPGPTNGSGGANPRPTPSRSGGDTTGSAKPDGDRGAAGPKPSEDSRDNSGRTPSDSAHSNPSDAPSGGEGAASGGGETANPTPSGGQSRDGT